MKKEPECKIVNRRIGERGEGTGDELASNGSARARGKGEAGPGE